MPTSKIFKIAFLLCTVLILSACASEALEAPVMMGEGAPSAPMEQKEMVSLDSYQANQEEGGPYTTYLTSDSSIPSSDVERVIIKTASLIIVVNDPPASMDKIKKVAEEMGGFIVSSNLNQITLDNGVKVPQGSMAIRVPAERLDEALQFIHQESDQLPLNENVNSQDVTQEYVDLESRLKNLEATEKQLNAPAVYTVPCSLSPVPSHPDG